MPEIATAGTLELLWLYRSEDRTASLLHSGKSGAFDTHLPLSDGLHTYSVPSHEATRRQLLRTWCFQTRQADKSGALRLRQTPELDELAPTPSVVEWNIRMSKMFFLTCCERTMEWIFIPSQSRSWRRVCWGAKHRKHLKSSSMITYRLLWIAQIARLDAQCLYGVLGAWIGSRPCRLEMRLVWSLDRNVATAMKARKLPMIIGGFKKHTRWKGTIRLSEVSGHKCRPRLYTSGQSYLPRV